MPKANQQVVEGVGDQLNVCPIGKGSYGIFYVNDDEDTSREYFGNVFRVHRLMSGNVEELADPFFGPIIPNLEPMHPYDRDAPDES